MKPVAVMLAAGVLLGMAGQQLAYAQTPSTFEENFEDVLSLGDEIAVAQVLSLEIVETIGISDALNDAFQDGSPETHSVSLGDTITIQDSEQAKKVVPHSSNPAKITRSMSDNVTFEERLRAREQAAEVEEPEPPAPSHEVRSLNDGFAIQERIFLSGSVVPPSAPELSVAGSQQSFNLESAEAAVITFISSSSGTYRVDIQNEGGERVAAVSDQMAIGENNAMWKGTDSKGDPVSDGTYTYFITADNDVGTRTPPAEGDGTIVVSGAPEQEVQSQINWTPYAVIIPVIAAAGAGAYLFSRRRNKLVVYLPAGAAPVIDEIRERYPRAEVGEYVSPQEGGSEVIKGVSIPSPRSSDEEWFSDIIRRAKELAGVDSINISHKGKTRPV